MKMKKNTKNRKKMKTAGDIPDSRLDFEVSWLAESPEGFGETELIDMMSYNITDALNHGLKKIDLGTGYFKIEGHHILYYWYESDNQIQLAAEFSIKPHAIVVNAIGKLHKKVPPYATDLYNVVLNDRKNITGSVNNIRLLSDKTLSNSGLEIWKNLLKQGHKISVYDSSNPGASFVEIENVEELLKFFKHDDLDFRRWQYVLSEAKTYAETRAIFNTRRMRELAGTL